MSNMDPVIKDLFDLCEPLNIKPQYFMMRWKTDNMKFDKSKKPVSIEKQRAKMTNWLKKNSVTNPFWNTYVPFTKQKIIIPQNPDVLLDRNEQTKINIFDSIVNGTNEKHIAMGVKLWISVEKNVRLTCNLGILENREVSLLQAACLFNRVESVSTILHYKDEIDKCDSHNETAIFYAINDVKNMGCEGNKVIEIMKLLATNDANFLQLNNQKQIAVSQMATCESSYSIEEKKNIMKYFTEIISSNKYKTGYFGDTVCIEGLV